MLLKIVFTICPGCGRLAYREAHVCTFCGRPTMHTDAPPELEPEVEPEKVAA
jgi:uncharacterized OB-fold protein